MRICSELIERVRTGECILFLGSGVHAPPPESSPYKYPEQERPPSRGGDLACKLAQGSNFEAEFPDDSVRDLMKVSLYIETTPQLGRNSAATPSSTG